MGRIEPDPGVSLELWSYNIWPQGKGEVSKRSLVNNGRHSAPPCLPPGPLQQENKGEIPWAISSCPGLTAGYRLGGKEDRPSSRCTGDSCIYVSQAGETEPHRVVACSKTTGEPSCTYRFSVPTTPILCIFFLLLLYFPLLLGSQKPAIHFTPELSWGGGVNQIFFKLLDFSGLMASAGFSGWFELAGTLGSLPLSPLSLPFTQLL